MKIVVRKWQDVAKEYRVMTFSDPADGLHASHELTEEIPFRTVGIVCFCLFVGSFILAVETSAVLSLLTLNL